MLELVEVSNSIPDSSFPTLYGTCVSALCSPTYRLISVTRPDGTFGSNRLQLT